MTEAPPLPPTNKKPQWFGVVGLVVIYLIHLLLLLLFASTAWHRLNMPEEESGGIGVRFEENVYWSPEVEMTGGQKALMAVYWGYPLWLAAAAYVGWRLLRIRKPWSSLGVAVLPFFSFLAGMIAIGLWSMSVGRSGSGFYEELQKKHPGVPGFIVIKGENGEVIETKKVIGHGPEH